MLIMIFGFALFIILIFLISALIGRPVSAFISKKYKPGINPALQNAVIAVLSILLLFTVLYLGLLWIIFDSNPNWHPGPGWHDQPY